MRQFYNINFLRYFYSAAKHRSVSKAAHENFVTQSAISQGIKKLEIEVGKQLVSNRKNRFELTQDGLLLLEKCDNVFSTLAEIDDLFNEQEGIYKGELSFATNHSFAISALPAYFNRLFALHPNVKPVLRLGHSGIIREWVSKGEVEFGLILAKEKDYLSFKTKQICTGTYGLYQTKTKNKSAGERMIISPDSHEDRLIINHLTEHGYNIPPIVEMLSWEAIAGMVKEHVGIGILPDYVAKKHNLVPLNIDIPTLTYTIIAISSQKKELSRNAKMFLGLGDSPAKGPTPSGHNCVL
jgi:DNA-binding transcriptional LysR family regulator